MIIKVRERKVTNIVNRYFLAELHCPKTVSYNFSSTTTIKDIFQILIEKHILPIEATKYFLLLPKEEMNSSLSAAAPNTNMDIEAITNPMKMSKKYLVLDRNRTLQYYHLQDRVSC
jgi:hypothetical protein